MTDGYLSLPKIEFWITIILVIQGLLQVVMAYVIFKPSHHFKHVATTQGSDIKELTIGLKELSFAFFVSTFIVLITATGEVVIALN